MELKDKIIRISLLVLGAAVLGWCVGLGIKAGKKSVHKLTILHVNDTHSHMEPVRSGEYAGMGGALERAAYIDSVRTADGAENVLLLHAGDFVQGTSYFSELGGTVEVSVLNALGYDAVTLGNHEFDNGIEGLGTMLSGLNMPVVVCNYDFSPFEAGKYIRPYVVLEKAGLKIGVIGVLCGLKDMVAGDIANRIPAFDTIPTVQKYIDELRPSCDLVVLLTHIGYTEHNPGDLIDSQLAAATHGADLIIGGHSHTFLEKAEYVETGRGAGSGSCSGSGAAGAASGSAAGPGRIPIVQTGWMGTYMGEFHITVRK